MRVVVVERLPLRCRFRKSRLFTLRRGPENSSVIGKRALLPGKGVNAIPEPRACLMYAQFIPGLGLMIGNPAPLCARSELVARQWRDNSGASSREQDSVLSLSCERPLAVLCFSRAHSARPRYTCTYDAFRIPQECSPG